MGSGIRYQGPISHAQGNKRRSRTKSLARGDADDGAGDGICMREDVYCERRSQGLDCFI